MVKANVFDNRQLNRILFAVIFVCAVFALMAPKVHANGVTRAPLNNAEKTRSALCYDTSPANRYVTTFGVVWINDTPTSDTTIARWDETMSVAWNATSVSATMWTTAYNCPVSQGGVAFSNAQIFNLAPASGGSVPISFTSGTSITRGTGTTYPGQFTNPPGALRVTLNVTGKGSGCYSVAYRGTYRDSRGTGSSNTYFTTVCITRQAVPSATLDGYKIDDQGFDATLRPNGGFTATPASAAVPFSTKRVYVSGSSSDAANPFYFTGGSGRPIAIGSSGVTAHTVSVDVSGLPTYKLIGYAICYSGQSNCTNAGVAYGSTYYKALPSGTNSFTYSFAAGRAYHLRWIFKLNVGVQCGDFSTTPSIFDSRTPFTAKATVEFTVPYTPVGPTMNLQITSKTTGTAVNFNTNSPNVTPVLSGGNTLATGNFGANAPGLGPTLATGVYNIKWTYDDAGLPQQVCTDTINVANQPYMHVYGGDVMAGTSVTGETTTNNQLCQTNNDAGVYGWNNHTTNFTGAGAQYAVMAMDQVLDFASASGAGNQPAGLSFANAGLSASQLSTSNGLFGGSFGGTTVNCNFTGGDSNPVTFTTDQTISPTTVGLATSDIRYVIGKNVYIAGNIVYAGSGGSWSKVSDIPYFKLVVIGGNIYIDNNVSQLDGVYVAEQDENGNGGSIYTCATAIGLQADPTSASFYSTCNTKLVVNGAFAAQQIQFLRTFGTVGNASTDTRATNNAAEVFNYSPEVWLPRNGSGSIGSTYDAITGLPPVL